MREAVLGYEAADWLVGRGVLRLKEKRLRMPICAIALEFD